MGDGCLNFIPRGRLKVARLLEIQLIDIARHNSPNGANNRFQLLNQGPCVLRACASPQRTLDSQSSYSQEALQVCLKKHQDHDDVLVVQFLCTKENIRGLTMAPTLETKLGT